MSTCGARDAPVMVSDDVAQAGPLYPARLRRAQLRVSADRRIQVNRLATWASGAFLASIFMAIAAALTSSAVPAQPPSPLAAISPVIQPAAHVQAHLAGMPLSYRVRPGDTLSSIARRLYGSADLWPALWYVNRHSVANPDSIAAGQVLALSAWHPHKAWIRARALAAIPAPPAPQQATLAATSSQPQDSTAAAVPTAGMSSFQQCVIQAESGGDPSAVNPSSGAGGLYGFLPSTWAGLGFPGLPEDAPVSEQNAAFAKEYAQSGTSAWSAYDGC